MTVLNSAGVYDTIKDQSFIVNGSGIVAGAIVISSKRGPTDVTTVTSAKQFVALYGLPTKDNPSMYSALRFLSRASILTVKRVVNDATVAEGDMEDDSTLIFEVEAANPGTWGNNVTVEISPIVGVGDGSFLFLVKENGNIVESYTVSRDPDAKDGFGANMYIEEVVNNRSNFVRVVDNPLTSSYEVEETLVATLSGGTDDTVAPSTSDIVDGWDEFLNQEKVNAQLLINAGWAAEAIHLKMISVAEARTDSIAILDVAESVSDDIEDMIFARDELGANTYKAALYGGWIEIFDQYNGRYVMIPPSGDVAANFVQAFRNGERWDAVAGLRRGIIPNVTRVSLVMSEGDRDLLYVNGINPITTISGTTAVIWGQKTLQRQASALTSLNVVTNVMWMTGAMKEALQPFVFQNNTEFTRNNISFLLNRFLGDIQERDGLYAFEVVCDETNNTPQVIDELQMIVDVYVQPVRAAEVIRLNVIVTPTGVTLSQF